MALPKKFYIVGGGAAGFFAAINAKLASTSLDVTILEGTPRLLTKVRISGGGRCNVTHNCFEVGELVENYPRGQRELRGPFSQFQPRDTVSWFRELGVELKTEADGRMFPVSNRSQTIIDCFLGQAESLGIKVESSKMLKSVTKNDQGFSLDLGRHGKDMCHDLLMATGSAPQGYKILKDLGHSLVEPVPSLFTFKVSNPLIDELPGLSFANVSLQLKVAKKVFKQKGPLLITHWGFSGPGVLRLSAFAARELAEKDYQASLTVNFLSLSEDQCYDQILDHKGQWGQKQVRSDPLFNLPKRFWQRLVAIAGGEDRCWRDLPNKLIRRMSQMLVRSEFQLSGKGEFKEEFVTAGGVDLREVNFKTMESKKVPGLYLAGEVLNIDGVTGGFNFQNAWTGGWICAQAVAAKNT